MDPNNINVEKLAAELAGNTMLDENSMNDQTYQQIVAFLKSEKINVFRYVSRVINCYWLNVLCLDL